MILNDYGMSEYIYWELIEGLTNVEKLKWAKSFFECAFQNVVTKADLLNVMAETVRGGHLASLADTFG